jgi:nitrate/nitrite-specific signal transduction histidine kinase
MPSPSDDLSKSVEDLINDIDRINSEGTSATNPKANAIAVITAFGKFCCILTILSRQAERQTTTIVRLTWALLFLTFILLVIAAIQLAIMIPQN